MPALDNLLRRIVNNRRRQPRKHRVCEAIIRSEHNMVLFRGKTVNISSSGARIEGLPSDLGVDAGNRVLVELLVPPRGGALSVRRIAMVGRIVRVHETPDTFTVAVRFEHHIHI